MTQTQKLCSFPGCTKPMNSRGWCKTHYMRWRKHGDPSINLRAENVGQRGTTCSLEGCDKQGTSRGWCGMHYMRWWQNGHPLAPLRKPGRKQLATVCSVEGCGKGGEITRGLCRGHYWR